MQNGTYSMKRLWTVVIAAAALACVSAMAQSVSHGNTLYHSVCVSCHGDPPSGGPETAASAAAIRVALQTVPTMRPFNGLFSDADLADIFAYLQSIRQAPPPPPVVTANTPGALSGLFYNSLESGWGVHLTQRGSNVFAAWYTYDGSGNPKWYVSTCAMAGGATGTTGTCSGQLFEVSGPRFFGVLFDTRLVTAVPNGTLQIAFSNADNAQMTYTGVVAGTGATAQTRTVSIVRQPLSPAAVPDVNYTDIWWGGPSESGWGIAITQQGTTVFLAWYVYDSNAKPTWFVALCTINGTQCTASTSSVNNVLAVHGPAFGPTFNSSVVTSAAVGSVSVNFTDPNNGVLNYTVNGVNGTKQITRQVF